MVRCLTARSRISRSPNDHVETSSGYVALTNCCNHDPKRRTWEQVLGRKAPTVVIARGSNGTIHRLIKTKAALEVLRGMGVKPADHPALALEIALWSAFYNCFNGASKLLTETSEVLRVDLAVLEKTVRDKRKEFWKQKQNKAKARAKN